MTLYHGTNADIELIDLTKGMRHKDFGKGFYVTPDKNTAIRMAQKKARLFGGVPTLITYELDPVALQSDLKVKVFPEKACVEWLLFVDANRDKDTINPIHDYDIVIGPIANDRVGVQLWKYETQVIDLATLIHNLRNMKGVTFQYFFGTEQAIKILRRL
jgi:hypothetical protein